MDTFCPLQINLKNKKCLVVGGGTVAERKVTVLLAHKTDIQVVSPSLTSTLKKMVTGNEITYLSDRYHPVYLNNKFLVIAATNNREVNRQIAEDCIARNILVNSASGTEQCTFFLPAILRKNCLTIAVSTSGVSPALASRIRDKVDDFLGEDYNEFLSFLSFARMQIIEQIEEQQNRKKILEHLASDEFFSVFKFLPASEREKKLLQIISTEKGKIKDSGGGKQSD
ncbi:MAG: bifunctional precorrin-2 dehydrogenase/sirohydrochlorin ferrochelatase [Bacillota bacterium]